MRSEELDCSTDWEYIPVGELGGLEQLRPGDALWICYRGRLRKVGKLGGLMLTWGVQGTLSASSSTRGRVSPKRVEPSEVGAVIDVQSTGLLIAEARDSTLKRLVIVPKIPPDDWGETRVDTPMLCWVYRSTRVGSRT